MADFVMPSLGADMDAGVLLEWYVGPGDTVKRGDIVALVDTDKAAIEIEIFEDGVVGELLVPPGEKVPVGTALATIRAPGIAEPAAAAAEPEPVAAAVVAPAAETAPAAPAEAAAVAPAAPPPERPHATPAARRHALELGVDLAALRGSGKHGVITKADVDGAAAAKAAPPPPEAGARPRVTPLARRLAQEAGIDLTTVTAAGPDGVITAADIERAAAGSGAAPTAAPPSPPRQAPAPEAPGARPPAASGDRYAGMRRAIAAALGRSKREIPHYYLSSYIELSRALGWLEEANLERPPERRIVPAVLLLKAAALACRDEPEMNGFWIDGGFRPSEAVHLGIGISLRQGGLIAPAIHDLAGKDLDTLMADLRDLVKRARRLQLRSSEMQDATITVTNLGDQGVDSVYGIIYPPQVALVGFGKVLERPWAENGMLAVRPVVQATLAADHRASDGHRGGRYLAAIARYLQNPEAL